MNTAGLNGTVQRAYYNIEYLPCIAAYFEMFTFNLIQYITLAKLAKIIK